jgi:hypothetical protein
LSLVVLAVLEEATEKARRDVWVTTRRLAKRNAVGANILFSELDHYYYRNVNDGVCAAVDGSRL